MAKINFYLRDTKAQKETPIIMFLSYNNQRIKIGKVGNILPEKWDILNQKVRKKSSTTDNLKNLNQELEEIEKFSLSAYDKYLSENGQQQPSKELIKSIIINIITEALNKNIKGIKKDDEYNLLSYTDNFITESEQKTRKNARTNLPIKPNTIKVYKTFRKNLEELKNAKRINLHFDNIDLKFFESFVKWMTEKKLYKTNSLAKHIKIFKVIMNEAYREQLTTFSVRNDNRFNASAGEQPETVYLNKAELQKLYELDLSKNYRLEKVRDLFLIGCWTGLRFSDFSNIKPTDFKDGFIVKKTQKTGKVVNIPIHPIVKEIIEKYKGKTDNNLPETISNQKMNIYIKEVCEIAEINENIHLSYYKGGDLVDVDIEKFKLVSSHTARRSFATNMYLNGNPVNRIMAITGHSSPVTFQRYIRITDREHAEQLVF